MEKVDFDFEEVKPDKKTLTAQPVDFDFEEAPKYKVDPNLFTPTQVEMFYQGNVPGVVDYINKNKPNGVEAAKYDDTSGEIVVRKGKDWFSTGMKNKGDADQSVSTDKGMASFFEPKEMLPNITSAISGVGTGALAGAAAGPVGAVILGLAGGVVGYQAGQQARRILGSQMGVYKMPEDKSDVELAYDDVVRGAEQEAAGFVLGTATGAAVRAGSRAVGRAGRFLKGISDEAWTKFKNDYLPLGIDSEADLVKTAKAKKEAATYAEAGAKDIQAEIPKLEGEVTKTENTLRTIKTKDRAVAPTNVLDESIRIYDDLEAKAEGLDEAASKVVAAEKEVLEKGKAKLKGDIEAIKGEAKTQKEVSAETFRTKEEDLRVKAKEKKSLVKEKFQEAKVGAKETMLGKEAEVGAEFAEDVGQDILATKDKYQDPAGYLSNKYTQMLETVKDKEILNTPVDTSEAASRIVGIIEDMGIAASKANKRNPEVIARIQYEGRPSKTTQDVVRKALHGLGVPEDEAVNIMKQFGASDDDISELFTRREITVDNLRTLLADMNAYRKNMMKDSSFGTSERRLVSALIDEVHDVLYNKAPGGKAIQEINKVFSQSKKVMEAAKRDVIGKTAETLAKSLASSKGPEIRRTVSLFRKYVDPDAFPHIEKLSTKIEKLNKITDEYRAIESKIKYNQRLAEAAVDESIRNESRKIRLTRASEVQGIDKAMSGRVKGATSQFEEQAAMVRGKAEEKLSLLAKERSGLEADMASMRKSLVSQAEAQKEALRLQKEKLKLENDYVKTLREQEKEIMDIIPKDKTNGKVGAILAVIMGGGAWNLSRDPMVGLAAAGAGYFAEQGVGAVASKVAFSQARKEFYTRMAQEIWEGDIRKGPANAIAYYRSMVEAGLIEKNPKVEKYISAAMKLAAGKNIIEPTLHRAFRNGLYQAITDSEQNENNK